MPTRTEIMQRVENILNCGDITWQERKERLVDMYVYLKYKE